MSTVAYGVKGLHGGSLTGTVTYQDGSKVLGTATLKGNSASLQISSLQSGSHNITATYSGDDDSSGSTSPALALTVAQAKTETQLQSSTNPSTLGDPVTFAAHVSSSAGTPTGTVQFSDGATPIGTAG